MLSWRKLLFLHEHDYELVGTTYAKPVLRDGYDIRAFLGGKQDLARMVHGVTTRTWKCADPACPSVIVSEALGAPMAAEDG